MGQFGIGQAIKRFEDQRLLRGGGRFHEDVNLPGQAHAVIVRSMHAHARIRAIDTSAALGASGVLAVFTGADLARDGLGVMQMALKRKRPDGSPMFAPPHRGLTQDRVRYVGDPVALVVAETRAQAEDAADLVRVDYEPLPSVTSTAEAAGTGSPAVWDECPDNISNVFETGDRAATEAAFAGGWFHTGDLAVEHPDGYIEIKDRLKDIIISGGENISSLAVEAVLTRHPAVALAAVVARPDERWGETPCAFVELRPGQQTTAEELIAFARENLPHFAAPRTVIFGPLPTTATGKIQKFELRQRARAL
jgi:acyl-CoA synthetase (AMP-forming)/AMP-acid ligase II